MTSRILRGILGATFVLALIMLAANPAAAGGSSNVVIIGGSGIKNGGVLPTTGTGFSAFTFANMAPNVVTAASLNGYDTAVLNVASWGMYCNMSNLPASAKTDLINFVASGKKLIIYDSECPPMDYSWLPFPFHTANPGAMGAPGTLTIVEENTLSSNIPTDPHYIDAVKLGSQSDAVGDMNVMTTYDPSWCVDMSGTNYLHVTGPVHTYAKYGGDRGLIMYNGLDQDYDYNGVSPQSAGWYLSRIWLYELQQPFNPSNLPCGYTVVGVTLTPMTATNQVGTSHTVTANLTDLLGHPQPGITVTIDITSGPDAALPPVTGTTDSSGNFSMTYTNNGTAGTDKIKACFIDQRGTTLCSQEAEKIWAPPTPVELLSFTTAGAPNGVLLKWETATEIDTAGFHILRSDKQQGKYARITKSPIAAQGGATSGAGYSYVDKSAKTGHLYYYKLEDIDSTSVSTLHGPVSGYTERK